MKPSKTQLVIACTAAVLGMLVVFHQPLGFAQSTADIMQVAALAGWIVFFILWRRQKTAAKTAGIVHAIAAPSQQKKRKMLTIILVAIASLSGPWWLPYTGTSLPFPALMIVSLINCVLCVSICLIVWRRSSQGSNQAMQRTADRPDVQL